MPLIAREPRAHAHGGRNLKISRAACFRMFTRLSAANFARSSSAARSPSRRRSQFFYDLGIPVGNGYGCTEAGTAITVNDLKPFRPDTVGKPLPAWKCAS